MSIITSIEGMCSGMPICWLYKGEDRAHVGFVTQVRLEQGEVEVREDFQVSTFCFADMTSLHEVGSAYLVNEILRLRAMVAHREAILHDIAVLARKASL